jgi:hypothetical protein
LATATSMYAVPLRNASSIPKELNSLAITPVGDVTPDDVAEPDALTGLTTDGVLTDNAVSEAADSGDGATTARSVASPLSCSDCRQLQPRMITGGKVLSSSTNRKQDTSSVGGTAGAGGAGATGGGGTGTTGAGGAGSGGTPVVFGASGSSAPLITAGLSGAAPLAATSAVDPITSNPEPDTVVLLLSGLGICASSLWIRRRNAKNGRVSI